MGVRSRDMEARAQNTRRRGISPAIVLSGAVFMLALPSAVLAFTSRFDARPAVAVERDALSDLGPAVVDPRFARTVAMHKLTRGQLFRFTPAGSSAQSDRAVTVAVRVDPESARAISVRKAGQDAQLSATSGALWTEMRTRSP